MSSNYPFFEGLRTRVALNLDAFDPREIADDALRAAAVTIVIAKQSDATGACMLLTRRPSGMRRHAGQYALPGGRVDQGETFVDAALRELHEELGLKYDADAIIGVLDDYQTRSGFCIRPFVIWGGTLETLKPDPTEVAKVFEIPLDDLDHPDVPYLRPGERAESPVISVPIEALGHMVHAPTAAMIYQFREVALHGRDTRVAHFDQPEFAWK